MTTETAVVETECSEPERKQSSDGAAACVDDRQGSDTDAVVVASSAASAPAVADKKPKRQRAPRAPTKKVAMDAPPCCRHEVDVNDPLFFAGLNILHKRLEAHARRTRFSSMPIA